MSVAKLVLYAGAPFFAYPFKPFMNAALGAPYERAYAHFRRDHDKPANLFYHFVCLVFQLTYNFGLLGEADSKVLGKGLPLLSLSTSAIWIATLVLDTSAPALVKALSVVSILVAYKMRNKIRENWDKLATMQAVIEVLALQIFVINKVRDTKGDVQVPVSFAQFVALLIARLGLQHVVLASMKGALVKQRTAINVAVAMFMLKTCQDPFGGGVPPFFLGLVGYAIALLTDQPWLFFYSGGFLATLGQGISHHMAAQEGTLPQLAKLDDELAHATFFPNLLFHSIHESAFGSSAAPLQ